MVKPEEFDRFGEVMGFTLMNGKRVAIKTKLAKRIITTELSNQIYWMHNRMLAREDVLGFLRGSMQDIRQLKKIAYYILFFAENLVFTNTLLTMSEGEEVMKEYLKVNTPLLELLRKLYNSVDSSSYHPYEIVAEMLDKCLEMGVDPL